MGIFFHLKPFLKKGIPVVGLEPSCILSFRDELPSLIKSKEALLLSQNSFTFEELNQMIKILKDGLKIKTKFNNTTQK